MKSKAWHLMVVSVFACGCASSPVVKRSPKTVTILALGSVDAASLRSMEARLEKDLPVKVRVAKQVNLPKETYTKPRNRYRADKLLDWLVKQDRADVVLGVTAKDISTTLHDRADWGVFGLAFCPGRAAVISSFRLQKKGGVNPDERLRRVAVHEVGHALGLDHCPRDCIMADAKGKIQSIDRHTSFCASCLGHLGR